MLLSLYLPQEVKIDHTNLLAIHLDFSPDGRLPLCEQSFSPLPSREPTFQYRAWIPSCSEK